MLFLVHDDLCQRLQAMLPCYLRPRAAAWLVRHIEILYLCGIPRLGDTLPQFLRELSLTVYGLEDRLLAFLQFFQFLIEVTDGSHLHLIEVARCLLTVTTDEGDGSPGIEELNDGFHLFSPDIQALRDYR